MKILSFGNGYGDILFGDQGTWEVVLHAATGICAMAVAGQGNMMLFFDQIKYILFISGRRMNSYFHKNSFLKAGIPN